MTHGLIFLSIFLAVSVAVADVSVSCNCNCGNVIVAYVLKRCATKVPVGREFFSVSHLFFSIFSFGTPKCLSMRFPSEPHLPLRHATSLAPSPRHHHPFQPRSGVCMIRCMCGWNVPQAASFVKIFFSHFCALCFLHYLFTPEILQGSKSCWFYSNLKWEFRWNTVLSYLFKVEKKFSKYDLIKIFFFYLKFVLYQDIFN